MDLEVITTLNGKVLDVKVNGDINSNTYNILDESVAKYIEDVDRINLDLGNVNYMSSAGIRVILALHKHLMTLGGLHIYNSKEAILDVFSITGFIDLLFIEQ